MTTKFTSYGKMPTEYESELYTILVEECAEVQQRVTKAMRFGLDEVEPGQELDNVARLSEEVGDLLAVIEMCDAQKIIDIDRVTAQRPKKLAKLAKYMQHEAPE
jgi:NTP pyrophosphatase (non-canonical NTP hydrolase)